MKIVRYLFSNWDGIRKAIGNKFIYLFLDYDGTLSRITRTPDKAAITDSTKNLLSKLSKIPNCKIAIVSGRALSDVSKRVGLKNIVYVGNHGFEIKGPKIIFRSAVSRTFKKTIKEIKAKLEKELSLFKGVFIEDKGFSLSVHYRLAHEDDISAIESKIYMVTFIDEFRNKIQVRPGKMTREIRPPILWDKGLAVLWLLNQQSSVVKKKKMEILPVYVGDDTTDEDAFRGLEGRGLTIFVGKPDKTKARFSLKDTNEVAIFLKKTLEILRKGKV